MLMQEQMQQEAGGRERVYNRSPHYCSCPLELPLAPVRPAVRPEHSPDTHSILKKRRMAHSLGLRQTCSRRASRTSERRSTQQDKEDKTPGCDALRQSVTPKSQKQNSSRFINRKSLQRKKTPGAWAPPGGPPADCSLRTHVT